MVGEAGDGQAGAVSLILWGPPGTGKTTLAQAIASSSGRRFVELSAVTAGIKDVHAEYPDLVNVIKRTAVLDILKDAFTPQSGSISADGLSQSVSSDMDKYQDANNKTIASIRDAIHGVRFTVC